MRKSIFVAQALLASCLVSANLAQAEVPSPETLAYTCVGCHGAQGNSTGPATPSIAGMGAEYFVDSMEAFKEGERPNSIMTRIAKGYSSEEIAAMSTYFAAQTYAPAAQEHDADMAASGAKLHDKFCEKCHADAGTDPEDESGYLSGQWGPYLQYSLEDFMAGDREMPKKMRKQVEKMLEQHDQEGVNNLLNFYATGATEVK
ncbi:MAG: c-type cytochrome [Granulosicoccaceae bacterium]